jgi:transposase
MDYRKPTTPTAAGDGATLFVALELSLSTWVVALRSTGSTKVSLHSIAAQDQGALFRLIDRAAGELCRAGHREVAVVSCYEAGRDGFWLHRRLEERGVKNRVLDAATLSVSRRVRRAKTDRLDVQLLLREVMALTRGESDCREVQVPSEADEDARRPVRERDRLKKEQIAHVARIKSLLALHGIAGYGPLRRDRRERLAMLRTASGAALPRNVAREIERELERLELVMTQLDEVERERDAIVSGPPGADAHVVKIQQLYQLRSIADETATKAVREMYHRTFQSSRKVGGFLGLDGSPMRSGQMAREQGISKRGNPQLRALFIQLSHRWVRHQPDSALTRWYLARLGVAKGAQKRKLIVALARKLAIALWRYLETGLVPEGALLKAQA